MSTVINNLLHYSYHPGCRRAGLPDEVVESASEQAHTEDAGTLMAMAIEAFRKAVDAELRTVPDGATHVVPLSSGLDSRAILATLLDRPTVERANVQTVTFGSPGTWDYEIAQQVAAAAGVENTTIDLTAKSFDWSVESLRDYAATRSCPGGVFDGYANSTVASVAPDESVIWAGFMGGPSAGGHQPADPCEDWASACRAFAERERYATGLTAPDFDPTLALPDEPFVSRRRLTFEEQLDFALRQQCAIAPVVIGSGDYRLPFTRPSWLAFSLNLPARHRAGRSLFTDAFSNAFPELFSRPTGANAGYPASAGKTRRIARRAGLRVIGEVSSLLGAEFTHPGTNYVDFESAFRSGQLRDTARELVEDFAERDVTEWLDPRTVWREHQDGRDRAQEIQALCYAELHLCQPERKATAEVV